MTPRARSRAVHAVLKRITYKPDWKITLRGRKLTVAMPSYDAVGRRRKVMAGTVRILPKAMLNAAARGKRARLINYVVALIHLRELHEIDEWLKVDGKHLVDPHPELAK